jgi:hypothetical protein
LSSRSPEKESESTPSKCQRVVEDDAAQHEAKRQHRGQQNDEVNSQGKAEAVPTSAPDALPGLPYSQADKPQEAKQPKEDRHKSHAEKSSREDNHRDSKRDKIRRKDGGSTKASESEKERGRKRDADDRKEADKHPRDDDSRKRSRSTFSVSPVCSKRS